MTAKEKAIDLVDRFKGVTRPFSKRHTLKVTIHPEHAKQCALICVEQVIQSCFHPNLEYWQEVKQEIDKL